MDNKGTRTMWMHRLICTFVVRIRHKTGFLMAWLIWLWHFLKTLSLFSKLLHTMVTFCLNRAIFISFLCKWYALINKETHFREKRIERLGNRMCTATCTCSEVHALKPVGVYWSRNYKLAYSCSFKFATLHQMSLVMRKPVFALCEQQRRRSAFTFAQSDQHLCCLLPR